jgi:Na+/melibiose symporter-like transporter
MLVLGFYRYVLFSAQRRFFVFLRVCLHKLTVALIIITIFRCLYESISSLLPFGTFLSLQTLRSVVSDVACSFRVVSVAEYYGLLFCILFVLFIPIVFLKEMDGSKIPRRTFNEHRLELWETLQNRTTLYLLIFVSGANCFSSMTNEATVYLQYYIIQLTNFQSGIGEKSMSMCTFVRDG